MKSEDQWRVCAGCSGQHPRCVCHRPRRRAALLMNLGTPDSTEVRDVRRYLREFLADPFVIKLPPRLRWMTPLLSSLIAHFRGPQSAHAYRSIWWEEGSPLKVITEQQCEKLKASLGGGWSVYYAMRYANPSVRDVLEQMKRDGITEMVVIPMYPQWAGPTTGTALDVLYREMRRQGLRLAMTVRSDWYDDRGYIDAQARLINRFVAERNLSPHDSFLLFSTHSMPASYIRDGDPYEGQVRRSLELVRQRLGWPEERLALSFQSKLGPVQWLSPSTEGALEDLALKGEMDVIVCPISFTADCLETLEEIGLRYAATFEEKSTGGRLHLVPSLNSDAHFISAVASLVRKGPQRVLPDEIVTPLSSSSHAEPLSSLIARLVMVGVSVPGRLEASNQPGAVDEQSLRELRGERHDVLETVRQCAAEKQVDGCVALNTCQRCELYILAERGMLPSSAALDVLRHFYARPGHKVRPVVLQGRDAYRRLLTTALGLSSMLPGDADVTEQVQSAVRMAEHAGTLSPGLGRLFDEAARVASTVRDETAWSGFMHDFGSAAMSSLGLSVDPSATDCVIIGGSTTSRQLLKAIVADKTGNGDGLTFAYRGASRKDLVQFVRRVAPHARRLRVDQYDDPRVIEAIAGADIVFLGVDCREPLLRRECVHSLRDFSARPLTIIDFNRFGSTEHVEGIPGISLVSPERLNAAASAFGEQLLSQHGFKEALAEARRYIEAAVCTECWSTEKRDCVNGPCHRCRLGAEQNGVSGKGVSAHAESEAMTCPVCR